MGIYVFDSDVLIKALEEDAAEPASHHDFGKNIIPALIHHGRAYSYAFYDENKKAAKYWRDIGTHRRLLTKRRWISARSTRNSTCTIRSGRCARTCRRRRRRSSCLLRT